MIEEIREKQNELKTFNVENQQVTPEEEEVLGRCKSFPMRHNHNRRWVKPLAYIFVFLIAAAGFGIAYSNKPELMPVLCIGAFALLIAVVIKERQFGMMKKLTQYFEDENGEFYRVIFTQGASITATLSHHHHGARTYAYSGAEQKARIVDRNVEEAQEAYAAFYYVQRFKAGIKDWDPINGGLAKVAHLKNLTLVKKGANKSVYTCEIGGKKKTLKILNAYVGLAEAVEK